MRSFATSLLALALLGTASNQTMSRNDVVNAVGASEFTWASGLPAGWTGSALQVTRLDFRTNVSNNGSCPGVDAQLLTKSQMDGCAVNGGGGSSHSPLVSNPTFSGGGFASWTSANTGGCSGALFSGSATTDEDGDTGLASASSLSCSATAAVVTLAQTFSTGGAPTSQTYSFWYYGALATAGDATNCTQGNGSVSLQVKVNSTSVLTVTPTLDGSWHAVAGTTSALVNGSNTFTIAATLNAASGQTGVYNRATGTYHCTNATAAQTIRIDNVSLSGTW